MVNDQLSDFVTRIRNAYMAERVVFETRSTKSVAAVAQVLVKEGYLKAAEVKDGKLVVTLQYRGSKPAVAGIRRVSKPGARVYSAVKDMPFVWSGLGINILSTPKGIMSHRRAKKENVGGEILAQVW